MSIRKRLPFLIWVLLIAILSLMPTDKLPNPHITNFDKAVHMTMYCILSISACIGFSNLQLNRYFKIALFSGLYGFSLECCQGLFCTYRSFEWWDAFYNVLGALTGVCIYFLFEKSIKKAH